VTAIVMIVQHAEILAQKDLARGVVSVLQDAAKNAVSVVLSVILVARISKWKLSALKWVMHTA
jgi:hypothetical protein